MAIPFVSRLSLLCFLAFVSLGSAGDTNFTCPVWRSADSMPYYPRALDADPNSWPGFKEIPMKPRVCLGSKSRSLQRDGVFTAVLLHQTEQEWQQHENRSFVLSEVNEAIYAGLDGFGRFGGTPSSPLQIHATIVGGGGDESGSPRLDAQVDLTHADEIPGGIGSTCYLSIRYPYPTYRYEKDHNPGGPLVKFKKEIVNRMFRCVLQYHRPQMDGKPGWWKWSAGRFFDDLVWPAPEDTYVRGWDDSSYSGGPWYRPRGYSEEYNAGDALWESWNYETSALFWHAAHDAGWDLETIMNWVKSFPKEAENDDRVMLKAMSQDDGLCRLFHDFGLRLAEGNISYSSGGKKISAVRGFKWDWRSLGARAIAVAPGQFYHWPNFTEILSDGAATGSLLYGELYAQPWHVARHELYFAGAQRLSIALLNSTNALYRDVPLPAERDLQWSLRPAANGVDEPTGGAWMSARGPGSSIQVNVTGSAGVPQLYELVITNTEWTRRPIYIQGDGRSFKLRVSGLY